MANHDQRWRARSTTALFIVALFAWCMLLRAPTFLKSVIDHDETLYLIAGDQWLQGNLPYETVFERKPPGIFAIFAVGIALFGPSLRTMRLIATLSIFASSVLLFVIGRQLMGSRRAGAAAAVAYPVFSLGLGGLAANSEIFFVPWNLLGLAVLLRAWFAWPTLSRRLMLIFASGVACGVAFQIKFPVALESAYFLALFMAFSWANGKARSIAQQAATAAAFAFGYALPTLAGVGYFAFNDLLGQYVYANFVAQRVFFEQIGTATQTFARVTNDALTGFTNFATWLLPIAITLLIVTLIVRRSAERSAVLPALIGWVIVALIESSTTLRFYGHYFQATLPAACLILGYAISLLSQQQGLKSAIALVAIVCVIPLSRIIEVGYGPWFLDYARAGPDEIARASNYMRRNLNPGETIFVVNDEALFYFQTRVPLPTRYVFNEHLWSQYGNSYANVNFLDEVSRILALRPAYIVVADTANGPRERLVLESISNAYFREASYGRYALYRYCGELCGPDESLWAEPP